MTTPASRIDVRTIAHLAQLHERAHRGFPRPRDVARGQAGVDPQPLLRRIEDFLEESLPKAVRERERRAAKLLKLDDAVSSVVAALKERGLTSPYLKPFVIARVNPIRFSKATEFDFDEVMDKTIAAATRFKVDRVKQEDVAKISGAAPPEED